MEVGKGELGFYDYTKRVLQSRYECDHEEQSEHHRNRERVVFLFSHISTQLMFTVQKYE